MLNHSNGRDQVTINRWFESAGDRLKLERIEFSNGTRWDSAQVSSMAATVGADTIIGASTDDFLRGGKGNDFLQGGDGKDTYVFASGDGQDTVNNLSNTPSDTDTLIIEGLTPEQLWFSRDANNLVIDVRGNEDRVTIKDWYASSAQQVDVIQADGAALNANAVDNLVNAMAVFGAPAGGEVVLTQAQRDQVNVVIAANWQ